LAWEYCPVKIVARLGVQIELWQNTASNRMPAWANASIFGVAFRSASRPPYAPMACARLEPHEPGNLDAIFLVVVEMILAGVSQHIFDPLYNQFVVTAGRVPMAVLVLFVLARVMYRCADCFAQGRLGGVCLLH
jgi:hypothetical protein